MVWNQIFVLTLLHLLYASTGSIEPIEGPLWLNRLGLKILRESDLKQEIKDIEGEERNSPYLNNLCENDISIKEKKTFLSPLKSSSEKRALSMFARWGAINTIGKERNPIRSGYPPKGFDSISTQTRSRLLGQPLRWG